SADWRNRRGIRRQRFRRRHGAWRSWFGWGWTFWHWFSLTKSFLLEPLAVNLVNAHKAPNEIYIFLISKSARFPRPGKLTRRFGRCCAAGKPSSHARCLPAKLSRVHCSFRADWHTQGKQRVDPRAEERPTPVVV